MEDCTKNDTRKRGHDDHDSDVDSHDSKRVMRVNSDNYSDADSHDSKRVMPDDSFHNSNSSESTQLSRVNSTGSCVDSDNIVRVETETDSYEVNEMTDEILNILDETDNVTEREGETTVTAVQGLDSVIKSFEDEILAPGPNQPPESTEFNPNLGYLLEASDDELGLPPQPTVISNEAKELALETNDSGRVGPDGVDLSGFYWFEEEIQNKEAFGLMGYGYDTVGDENGDGYVTIDGLFDYTEPSDLLWRSESLQAM